MYCILVKRKGLESWSDLDASLGMPMTLGKSFYFLSLMCLICKMNNRVSVRPNHLVIKLLLFPNNIHWEPALCCKVMQFISLAFQCHIPGIKRKTGNVFSYERFWGILHIDLMVCFPFLSFIYPTVSIGQHRRAVKRIDFSAWLTWRGILVPPLSISFYLGVLEQVTLLPLSLSFLIYKWGITISTIYGPH